MKKSKKAIVWFRNDLRLHDNEALTDALNHAEFVLPVFVFDERVFNGQTRFGFHKTGVFRSKFIIESVKNLKTNLKKHNSDLIIRIGKPEEIIANIALEEKTSWVFCNRERTFEEVAVQDKLEETLWSIGQEVRYSRGKMLYYTADLPFPVTHTPDVFTVFRKEVEKITPIREPLGVPEFHNSFKTNQELNEVPVLSDFGFDQNVSLPFDLTGGEDSAFEQLAYYFSNRQLASEYFSTRNESLGRDYSTKFSAHLSAGTISPKMVYKYLKNYEQEYGENKSTYWIFFELMWRDFFRLIGKKHKEKIFLKGGIKGIKPKEEFFDRSKFDRWITGMTGIPFVDANMRQLKETGYMSNRGRQNVASFMIHDLNLNWQWGASYFESLLIDYDPCSNYCNWNYIAGIGNDPREYRKFNVLLQSKKYDQTGEFIRRWIPELAHISDKSIHYPSKENRSHNKEAIYPDPIVDTYSSELMV